MENENNFVQNFSEMMALYAYGAWTTTKTNENILTTFLR